MTALPPQTWSFISESQQLRLELVDLAAEQMLQPVLEESADDILGEEALVAQVDELIANANAAQEVQDDEHSRKKQKTSLQGQRAKQSTSMMNDSTVWFGGFGGVPIVLREDTPTPTFYAFCPRHKFGCKQCRKDMAINRPDRDTVIRYSADHQVFYLSTCCSELYV